MSLRDELAQVLDKHRLHAQQPLARWRCVCGERSRTLALHAAHQADAVIAHLALTEEWESRGLDIGPQWSPTNNARSAAYLAEKWGHETRRRYVTPWENT